LQVYLFIVHVALVLADVVVVVVDDRVVVAAKIFQKFMHF